MAMAVRSPCLAASSQPLTIYNQQAVTSKVTSSTQISQCKPIRVYHKSRRSSPLIRTKAVETDGSTSASADAEPQKKKGILSSREGLEEVFAKLDTGKWECTSCGFAYDEKKGDPSYPVAPGVEFRKLPEDWRCPTCGAPPSGFISMQREVAGFAQNQKYGFGANSMTSGQKSLLIYGSLGLFFFLFLSFYFLE